MEVLALLPDAELKQLAHGPPQRPSNQFDLVFPVSLVNAAGRHLREMGKRSCEELVLFGGVPVSAGVVITALLMPRTEASWGHVEIIRSDQPTIATWLVERNHLLFLEAHTHGNHSTEISSPDKRHPVSVRDGFLTAIVPFYARGGLNFSEAGIWECRRLMWHLLPVGDGRDRFKITSDSEARTFLD